jgi:hypothetical protein
MKRILREIKAVGLKDWLWFNIALHRNEFHPSLNMRQAILHLRLGRYSIFVEYDNNIPKLLNKRTLAHHIDEVISELKN